MIRPSFQSLGRKLAIASMLVVAGVGYFGADQIMDGMESRDQTGAPRPIGKLLALLPGGAGAQFAPPAPDLDLLPPIPTQQTDVPKPLPRTKTPCVWKAGVRLCDGVPADAARGEPQQ